MPDAEMTEPQAVDGARRPEDVLVELRQSERLINAGRIASIIAHELATPLNVVMARAAMIAAGEVTGAELAESARIIVEQSERMSRIMKDLLSSVGKAKPARKPIEAVKLVHEATELLTALAQSHRVAVDVGGGLEGHTVDVDSSRLVQVLTNLITNGIQAAPPGGHVHIQISKVAARPDEGRAPQGYSCIAVSDDGAGIAPENLKSIFRPFFTTKSGEGGTGLGLAVAERIVREHGGWLDVESEIDHGARFRVCLPVTH